MVSDTLSDANAADHMHRELLLKFTTMDPDCAWLQCANAHPIFIVVQITLANSPQLFAPLMSLQALYAQNSWILPAN